MDMEIRVSLYPYFYFQRKTLTDGEQLKIKKGLIPGTGFNNLSVSNKLFVTASNSRTTEQRPVSSKI